MAIVHVVLMQFKEGVDDATKDDVCRRLVDLKNHCVHPATNNTYIKTSAGGKDNSVEGFQNGFTHAFVVEFETEQDRTYYAKEDPAHLDYVKSVMPVLEAITVVDFAPGVF
ncbi:MAG: hypothetical protein M1815_000987 [Lichina confinis]|nr:MAG: hypothetical protein M1815_000987 [Lichina confinis]